MSAATQVRPQSALRQTRATDPPVPIQASPSGPSASERLLAAKHTSPKASGLDAESAESAASAKSGIIEGDSGSALSGTRAQVFPPSSVTITVKNPSTASPTKTPCCSSQNASASQNPSGSWLTSRSAQVLPPSSVSKSREAAPGPALPAHACWSSNAHSMRKSSSLAPGGSTRRNRIPRSRLRSTTPLEPEAQTTSSPGAETPRKEAPSATPMGATRKLRSFKVSPSGASSGA